MTEVTKKIPNKIDITLGKIITEKYPNYVHGYQVLGEIYLRDNKKKRINNY